MNPTKGFKDSDLKYISEERKKEVEQVFQTLGILQKENPLDYSPSYNTPFIQFSEGYNTSFIQFSVLENKPIIFSSSS